MIFKIKYAVARNYCRNERDYGFVSKFAHHYKGQDDVVSYLPLKDAVHFETEKEVADKLATEPEWVRKKHSVVPFADYGNCCRLIKNQN